MKWLVLGTLVLVFTCAGHVLAGEDPAVPVNGEEKDPDAWAELPVPKEWNPSREEIEKTSDISRIRADPYTFHYLPGPTRAMLEKKAAVYRYAFLFFKGNPLEREKARKRLAKIGFPTCRYIVKLAGILVPKSERPVPDPEDWDPPPTPEERALDVVKDVQSRYLRAGEVDAVMRFFAVATAKKIELDAKLVDRKHEFRVFRVHPIPALWRVGVELGCDMSIIDPDAPIIRMMLPILFDMKIHGEDVGWLLRSLAGLGKFKAEIAEEVAGPVSLRVRADSFEDAFREIALKAGFKLSEIDGGFRVARK
jgi:hypothetical protein